jgi:hypothetical protein
VKVNLGKGERHIMDRKYKAEHTKGWNHYQWAAKGLGGDKVHHEFEMNGGHLCYFHYSFVPRQKQCRIPKT